MVRLEDAFKKGTEVLVFKYDSKTNTCDYENYTKGIITCALINQHIDSNGLYVDYICYHVLGEDGNKYYGNMGYHIDGGSFFMTKELYINYLKNKVEENQNSVHRLLSENIKLEKMIEKVSNVEKEKPKQLIRIW